MKKVLIISYYWPPSGGPLVHRVMSIVKYIKYSNLEPIVLTVNPKYASYPIIDESLDQMCKDIKVCKTKTKEVLSLYKKIYKKLPQPNFSNEGNPSFIKKIMRFIRGNFFIPDPRKGWIKYAYPKALEIIRDQNINCFITISPPHSVQLLGRKIKKKLNINWIVDLADSWVGAFYLKFTYQTFIAKRIDSFYESKVIEEADRITVDRIMYFNNRNFLKNKEVNQKKTMFLPHSYNPIYFDEKLDTDKSCFCISYVGSLGKYQPIDSFVIALKQVIDNNPKINVKFKLVGGGNDNTADMIFKKYGIYSNLFKYPNLARQKAIDIMKMSNALLMVVPNLKGYEDNIPGKLFEYMASERFIISLGYKNGHSAKIIDECRAGETININDKNDVEQIVSCLSNLIEQWIIEPNFKNESKKYQKYSIENLKNKFIEFIYSYI